MSGSGNPSGSIFIPQENTNRAFSVLLPLQFKLRFMTLAWDESNVRRQDYFTCIAAIASNRVGEPLAWDYVRLHWQEMVDRFGLNERYLGQMIPAITKNFATDIRLREMKEFFAQYPDAGAGERSRKSALATVQKNIKWLNTNLKPLSAWLEANM